MKLPMMAAPAAEPPCPVRTIHINAEAHGRQDARAILGLEPADLPHAADQVIVRGSA